MTSKKAYTTVKQKDLEELERVVAGLKTQPSEDEAKLRDACQSARSALERVVNSDDSTWQELQTTVDGDFRHAYDCLHRLNSN